MGEQERMVLLAIKGAISELPQEEQDDIRNAYLEIGVVVEKYGEAAGHIALGLWGAELVDKENK
jgi:hypothetical protein